MCLTALLKKWCEIYGQNCTVGNSLVKLFIKNLLPLIEGILYFSVFLFFFSEPNKLIAAVCVITGRLPVGCRKST